MTIVGRGLGQPEEGTIVAFGYGISDAAEPDPNPTLGGDSLTDRVLVVDEPNPARWYKRFFGSGRSAL